MTDDPPRWLTIPEAAAHYGVTENAIRNRIKQRKYENTELRDGRRMIRVDDAPVVNTITIGQPPPASDLARLIQAQERTNQLLEQLLAAQTQQPPARGRRRWKWPWTT